MASANIMRENFSAEDGLARRGGIKGTPGGLSVKHVNGNKEGYCDRSCTMGGVIGNAVGNLNRGSSKLDV